MNQEKTNWSIKNNKKMKPAFKNKSVAWWGEGLQFPNLFPIDTPLFCIPQCKMRRAKKKVVSDKESCCVILYI
jgi:hypothetical protein